jgi:methylated-DNA-[protein]-cysteine S-methyltransferase
MNANKNNEKVFSAKSAKKTFDTAGGNIAVTLSYVEKPSFKVKAVDISFCSGRSSKTGSGDLQNLFGKLEAWFKGEIDLLPLEDLDLDRLSAFERKVLCELRKRVPRGRTISYGNLAKLAGSPSAARAVGTVMSGNPFPLFLPCHRVIRNDGSVGFFQGGPSGMKLKKALLEVERINANIEPGAAKAQPIL